VASAGDGEQKAKGTMSNAHQTHGRPGARKSKMVRRTAVAVVALCVIAGAALGISQMVGTPAAAGERTLDTFVVAPTAFNVSTTSSGELEAKNQIEVRSELEIRSTIVEVIEEGKVVKKGDLLARLDSDQIQTQITDVSLRVDTSVAELEKATTACKIQEKENASKISQARLKVTLAELALRQWEEGDKVQKLRDHEQAITKATEEEVRLREKYEKCVALEKKGYVSTDQMKRDKLEYDDGVRALQKATLAREIYEKYEVPSEQASKKSDVDQAKEELERVEEQTKIELKGKEAERVTADRKLGTNREQLAKLQRQLERCTIVAPADGLVVYATSMERSRRGWDDSGPLTIGREVHPNMALFILPDTSEMVATVRVHETLASRIREGQTATVKVDAVGGRVFPARVTNIGILAESSGWRDPNLREYTVKLGLQAVEGVELKPSMRCEAEIIMGNVQDALAVPIQAVHNDGMLRFVMVETDGSSKYTRRPVRLGRVSESMGEVVAGLNAGERVLLRKATPGETLDKEFSDAELLAVGLKRGDTGQLVRVDGGGREGGGREGGPRQGGRRQGGQGGADAATPAGGAKADDHKAGTPSDTGAVKETAAKDEASNAKPEAEAAAAAPATTAETSKQR
jgi:HlyD family secretion protein